MEIIGRRVYPKKNEFLCTKVGDYGKDDFGVWWVWVPKCHNALALNIKPECTWKIEEHEDGTISVSPSINAVNHWHGYLKKGIWKEC